MEDPSLILIERLADRLCHDFASSAQAVASGFDLLSEAQGPSERQEAESFLAEAIAAQRVKIALARRAYGPAPTASDPAELESLVKPLFADIRPDLDWRVTATAGPAPARALLVLAQMAADILAMGGLARLSLSDQGGSQVVELDANGPRPMLRDEARSGLTGVASVAGLGGRWSQGAFVRYLSLSAGGEIGVEEKPKFVRIWIKIPKDA